MKARLALIVMLVAACAAPGAAGPGALASVTRPVVPRAYPDGGISLADPQSRGAKVAIESAYAACASGVADCPGAPPAIAELALVTDSQYGQIQSSGAVDHSITARLSWVFTWTSISCPRRLGPKPPSRAPTASACDWLVIIDATTGEYLVTYAGPTASN